jgi:hypothetical protein
LPPGTYTPARRTGCQRCSTERRAELGDPRSGTCAAEAIRTRRIASSSAARTRIEALERLVEVLGRHADRVALGPSNRAACSRSAISPRRARRRRCRPRQHASRAPLGRGAQRREVGGGEVSTAQIDRAEHPSRLTYASRLSRA